MPRLFPLLTTTYRYYMKKVKDAFSQIVLVTGIPINFDFVDPKGAFKFDFNSPKAIIEQDFIDPKGIIKFDWQLIERAS